MGIEDVIRLGTQARWQVGIAAHPYEPHDLRHYKGTLTDTRPADALSYLRR